MLVLHSKSHLRSKINPLFSTERSPLRSLRKPLTPEPRIEERQVVGLETETPRLDGGLPSQR